MFKNDKNKEKRECSISEIENTVKKARKWSQLLILLPLYLLQFCYGMQSGFPAILTPKLRKENCDKFTINDSQESWIGKKSSLFNIIIIHSGKQVKKCIYSDLLGPSLKDVHTPGGGDLSKM